MLLDVGLDPTCTLLVPLPCGMCSSHIASGISNFFSCLHFVDELIVEEGLLLLYIKTSSGKSTTTVDTKYGLDSKCFHML